MTPGVQILEERSTRRGLLSGGLQTLGVSSTWQINIVLGDDNFTSTACYTDVITSKMCVGKILQSILL